MIKILMYYLIGPSIWLTPITIAGHTFIANELFTYAMTASSAFMILKRYLSMHLSAHATNIFLCFFLYSLYYGLALAIQNNIRPLTALSQLIPITISWICGILWIVSAPELYENHPHLFLTSYNFLFSYLTVVFLFLCVYLRICFFCRSSILCCPRFCFLF